MPELLADLSLKIRLRLTPAFTPEIGPETVISRYLSGMNAGVSQPLAREPAFTLEGSLLILVENFLQCPIFFHFFERFIKRGEDADK